MLRLILMSNLLIGCSDYSIISNDREIVYVYVEDTAETEQTIEQDTDTASNPIWVDSFTQVSSMNGIDIVWVVDRSGSMRNNDDKLEQGMNTMLTILNQEFSVSWRIGIISTDPTESAQNQTFPLVMGDDYTTAMNNLSWIGSPGREQGFSAFQSYYLDNPYSQTWMRHSASLLVIFVSDEDDQSFNEFPQASDFSQWYSSIRQQSFLASIVISTEDSCEHDIGDRYIEATNNLQGQVVDICSEDWSPSIRAITDRLQPYEEWYLTHPPLFGESGIYIFEDGVIMSDTLWQYDPNENKITFDTIPLGDTLIEIAYEY